MKAASLRSAAPGVGAVVAFAPGGRDAIRLLSATGRAGAARLERFADGHKLRGTGLPFRFAVVFAVEVGDPALSAMPPQDLSNDVLAARPKALGAQLTDRQQAVRSPPPRIGR